MMIVVKRAQAFMSCNLESKSLCDPLNRQVAELLKFLLIHSHCGSKFFTIHFSLFPFRYSSVFV